MAWPGLAGQPAVIRPLLIYIPVMARRKRRALAPAPATAAAGIQSSITVALPAGSTTRPRASHQKGALARPTAAAAAAPGHCANRADRAVVNNAELRTNSQNILAMIRASRPKNTASAYEPKQEEFRQFCRQKHYQDGETVTEDKLLLFLVDKVVHRPLRSRSRKAAEDTPLSDTRLAWRSVRSYITAITDLYRAQKALGMNAHLSPREDNAREYIKSL